MERPSCICVSLVCKGLRGVPLYIRPYLTTHVSASTLTPYRHGNPPHSNVALHSLSALLARKKTDIAARGNTTVTNDQRSSQSDPTTESKRRPVQPVARWCTPRKALVFGIRLRVNREHRSLKLLAERAGSERSSYKEKHREYGRRFPGNYLQALTV